MKMADFNPADVKKVSTACGSLCMWVRAMDTYARVAKTVEPKKQKLKAAQKQLMDSQAMLKEKQASLAEVERRVAVAVRPINRRTARDDLPDLRNAAAPRSVEEPHSISKRANHLDEPQRHAPRANRRLKVWKPPN